MRVVKIFDTTLRDGEQSPGCSMDISEKLEMAWQLERLGVDIIEAGFAASSPEDFKAVQAISAQVKRCRVASLCRATRSDIDLGWAAVREARFPRLHIFIATSQIHMEYKLKMTQEQVLARVKESISYAKTLCEDIEFSAEDASRSDMSFLGKVFSAAIESGATVINVPDTVGYATPREMSEMINGLRSTVCGIEKVEISVHCHNDLGMAVANSLAAVRAGATQVECTINGIGERAGNCALEELVMALHTRQDIYGVETGIKTENLFRTSRRLSSITGTSVPHNKPIVGANAFAHEAGIHQHGVLQNPATYEIMFPESIGLSQTTILLGKHSGKHAFNERLCALGYELSEGELGEAFAAFKLLADKKKLITDLDIEAIMTRSGGDISQVYTLESFMVSTGTAGSPTATVCLTVGGLLKHAVATAPGPIDAAFRAIRSMTGTDITLESYIIQSVSKGADAIGEVIVRLVYAGHIYTGRGISIDILEASIMAYLNGMNKIRASMM